MDFIDKQILAELTSNCRVTYRSLGTKIGLSATAARNRVMKLRKSGLVSRGYVILPLYMLNANYAYASISTIETETDPTFMDELGSHPAIVCISRANSGTLLVGAQVMGQEGLRDLEEFIERFHCVMDVDAQVMYSVNSKSKPQSPQYSTHEHVVPFAKNELQILKHLWHDARMPATAIAEKTEYTPRRVQQIIGGLRYNRRLDFTVVAGWSSAGLTRFVMHVDYNSRKETPREELNWLQQNLENEIWNAWYLPNRSRMLLSCTAFSMKEIERATAVAKEAPFARHVACLVLHPERLFVGPCHIALGKLLGEESINRGIDYYNSEGNNWY